MVNTKVIITIDESGAPIGTVVDVVSIDNSGTVSYNWEFCEGLVASPGAYELYDEDAARVDHQLLKNIVEQYLIVVDDCDFTPEHVEYFYSAFKDALGK